MNEISAEAARRPDRLLPRVGESVGATAAGGTSRAPVATTSALQAPSVQVPAAKVPQRYAPKSAGPATAPATLSAADVSRVGWSPADLVPADLVPADLAQAPAPLSASTPRLRGDTAAQEICERLQAALFRIALAHDKAEPVLASITDRDVTEYAGVGPEQPPPRPTLYFRLFPALRRLAEIAEREAVIAEAQAEEIDRQL